MIRELLLSAVGWHLIQSTAFAAVAAVVALALRNNAARVRYGVWFAASMKFLIPFAALEGLGSHVRWRAAAEVASSLAPVRVERIGYAFRTPFVMPIAEPEKHAPIAAILVVLWICGALAVTARWLFAWRRLRRMARAGRPFAIDADVPVFACAAAIEPGVFGIFRPALLLPEGITERLSRTELSAVIAHEMSHVRRRDNLLAAIHMAVEAIFWFYPPVWWIGARLVEERERACDEDVVRSGNERRVYAEGILRTCEFYLESPVECVAGVTGADLKARIVRIMSGCSPRRLSYAKRAALTVIAALAIAAPLAVGLLTQARAQAQSAEKPREAFEVASIKPGDPSDTSPAHVRFTQGGGLLASNTDVKTLIRLAYRPLSSQVLPESQIAGLQPWTASARFDIEVKGGEVNAKDPMKMTRSEAEAFMTQTQLRLQSLLVDRFHLEFHRETRDMPVFALVQAKNGSKLKPLPPNQDTPKRGMRLGPGSLTGMEASTAMIAQALSGISGRMVIDRTDLSGVYDFELHWTPDPPAGAAPGADDGPSVFTAVQEQLGLKLEATKGPVEVLVIDRLERPQEN